MNLEMWLLRQLLFERELRIPDYDDDDETEDEDQKGGYPLFLMARQPPG